ncbi:MAG: DUF2207 domain-containing protein, partial [Pseudomonadota bacterium]|nr:DUF2207 domain-containing protein [Pseudomonadota bacterium]
MVRWLLVCLAAATLAFAAAAEELINRFDVGLEVEADGDLIVTETITVTAEGNQIRRGIFRDMPRYFLMDGDRMRYGYKVLSLKRNGEREPYETSTVNNAWRIRIGDEDRFLSPGEHVYEIRYRVKNQVRYFEEFDEIYWNVTGNYWSFPILEASARITLPEGAQM